MKNKNIAIILAGGKSKRFGSDKALFKTSPNATTNIERILSKIKNLISEIFISTNEVNKSKIHDLLNNQNVNLVTDIAPFQNMGPLSGIYSVLSNFRDTKNILLIATDYPWITSESISLLLNNLNTYITNQNICHYTLSYFQTNINFLNNFLQSNPPKLSLFLKKLGCKPLTINNNDKINKQFVNLNRRNDMLTKNDMSEADFQKLLRIALTDLRIRRTLLENDIDEENDQLRTLEQDEHLEAIEQELRPIKKDFDHYQKFLNPDYDIKDKNSYINK